MEIRTTIYGAYAITAEEGTQKGIFFRNPVQKVSYDAYYCNHPATSAWTYLKKIKNPIRRLYEILIGNGNIVKSIDQWAQNDNWAGFRANKLMSPVYFVREYRKLRAKSTRESDTIQKVYSYGYEGPYNDCCGACHIERTCIVLRDGSKIRMKKKDYYHYTYIHIIEAMLASGTIED